ncbi:hypothetical protein K439DRAFT_1278748, partial [Ramaria rubella]
LFGIAMDYLPVQALAIPCKHAFSSSAQTATACRNCLKPVMMEALQMLKFAQKKKCLELTAEWMIT